MFTRMYHSLQGVASTSCVYMIDNYFPTQFSPEARPCAVDGARLLSRQITAGPILLHPSDTTFGVTGTVDVEKSIEVETSFAGAETPCSLRYHIGLCTRPAVEPVRWWLVGPVIKLPGGLLVTPECQTPPSVWVGG